MKLMTWLNLIPGDLANSLETASVKVTHSRTMRNALLTAAFDPDHPNSLRANVQYLYRAAYSVRDRLSLDSWRVISHIDRQSAPPEGRIDAATLILRLDNLTTSFAAMVGLEQESMTRGPGWLFLDLGRRLERALHLVSLLRGLHIADAARASGDDVSASLEVLLELGESFMAYRERYFAAVERVPVLTLLLADETNPRALAFQLAALRRHLERLPTTASKNRAQVIESPLAPTAIALAALTPATTVLSPLAPVIVAMRMVDAARAPFQENPDLTHDGPALRSVLDKIAATLPEISNQLAHAYFSHAFARSA
ncbi:hypothetical protein CCP2SC5_410028 [Azospirillaceae bacterium]